MNQSLSKYSETKKSGKKELNPINKLIKSFGQFKKKTRRRKTGKLTSMK